MRHLSQEPCLGAQYTEFKRTCRHESSVWWRPASHTSELGSSPSGGDFYLHLFAEYHCRFHLSDEHTERKCTYLHIVRFFSWDLTSRYHTKTTTTWKQHELYPENYWENWWNWLGALNNKRLNKLKLLQMNRLLTEWRVGVNLTLTPLFILLKYFSSRVKYTNVIPWPQLLGWISWVLVYFLLNFKQKCAFSERASILRNSYRNHVLVSECILEWGLNLEKKNGL